MTSISQASSLSLSNNALVERLLSDIPFFSVGIMAFAVFTFFLVTKRSNLLATYLYCSALLAFIASILDLSQLLVRGGSKSILNGTGSFHGLIIGREIALSLSLGFRLIFFWGYIAGESTREQPFSPTADQESVISFQIDTNTSSWEVFGLYGTVMKWLLLLMIAASPVLQIVWRLAPPMNNHGPLYIVESSLEISALICFVIKLLLNVYFASDSSPWRSSLLAYIAPFLAIALGLAVAISNIFYFCFSETTLGRFLQAVELYILILWIMITAYRPPSRKPPVRIRPRSSFQSHPEKGPYPPNMHFTISHPIQIPGAAMPFAQASAIHPSVDLLQPVASTSKILASSHAGEDWTPKEEAHPFTTGSSTPNGNQRHPSPLSLTNAMSSGRSRRDLRAVTPAQQRDETPIFTLTAEMLERSATPASQESDTDQSKNESVENLLTEPSVLYSEGISPIPSPSSLLAPNYRAVDDGGTESPVYSLHGIIRNSKGSAPSYLRPNSGRFSALMREHKEMDRSISKLLSMQGSLQSVSSLQKAGSMSGQSEFSLSNFPIPPHMPSLDPNSSGKLSKHSSGDFASYRRLSGRDVPASVIHWRSDSLDVPDTKFRMNSEGTQYDVTSFIRAGTTNAGNSTSVKKSDLSDIESRDDASPKEDEHTKSEHAQESAMLPNQQSYNPFSGYESTENQRGRASPQPQLKPLYLSRTPAPGSPRPGVPRLSALNKSRTPVRIQIKPSAYRPRSLILSASIDPSVLESYEKPRPPPSVFRATRHNNMI